MCDVELNSRGQLRTPDVELAKLASRQHGVVTRAQLQALGFDRNAIIYRLKVARLHLHRDRDADLLNAGFSTLRVTDQRLKHQPTKEAQRLKDILRSRSR